MSACAFAPKPTELNKSYDPLSNEFSSYRVVREDFLNAVHLMEVYPDGSEELTAVTVLEHWKAEGYNFNTTYAVSPDDTRVAYTRYNSKEATTEIYLADLNLLNETLIHSQTIQLSDQVSQIEDLRWLDLDTVQFLIEGQVLEVQAS